jgi:hypothetical protein
MGEIKSRKPLKGEFIMMKIAELTGQELKWVQPDAMKMEYELRSGDKVAATLRFRSSFGTFATAASDDGSWTFKRVGFWQTKVTIRTSGAEADMAVFKNNTWGGGGTLELPDGRKFLANTNSWASQYNFKTEAGDALISYRKIGGMLHLSSQVEIHAPAKEIAEMPWMVLLGWYLTVMMCMDYAAVAAVI